MVIISLGVRFPDWRELLLGRFVLQALLWLRDPGFVRVIRHVARNETLPLVPRVVVIISAVRPHHDLRHNWHLHLFYILRDDLVDLLNDQSLDSIAQMNWQVFQLDWSLSALFVKVDHHRLGPCAPLVRQSVVLWR